MEQYIENGCIEQVYYMIPVAGYVANQLFISVEYMSVDSSGWK